MKKRMIALLLALLLMVPSTVLSFAQNPTTLAAPQNFSSYEDNGVIRLRWTVPQSVVDVLESDDTVGALYYCIDWKVDNGPWHYDVASVKSNTYDIDRDAAYYGLVDNVTWDENHVQDVFVTFESLNLSTAIDLNKNKYTFRMRFAFYDYDKGDDQIYVTSAYSNETSIGGGSGAKAPTTLAAPTNLKGEVRKDINGKDYFYLTWANPASVSTTNEKFPIGVKVDFKVGNGKWFSETQTQEWWGADLFETKMNFNPVEREYVDKIVVEANTYYFRILYAYEPTYGTHVYSPFSNTISIGLTASEWARGELQGAFDNGLVPDILRGKDLTKPITREEFAELAVLLYEKTTGKKAEPVSPNPLNDTNNPQILKAYALGITKGTKVGTSNIPFEPNTLINREQVATMLFRTIKLIKPTGDFSIAGVKDFPDQKDIADFAVEATKFMSKMGIVKGDSKGCFMPKATTSAQQAAGYGMASREAAILMASRTYNSYK